MRALRGSLGSRCEQARLYPKPNIRRGGRVYSPRRRSIMKPLVRCALPLTLLPLLAGSAGCDLMTAGMSSQATTEWHKSYQLAANGRIDIDNTNGKIEIEPSTGTTVDVVAIKKAHGSDDAAAK